MDLIERYKGSLFGLAIGDAIGTTLEFRAPGTFEPIKDMVGGGSFRLHAGEWTDDTSMALCLASSLIESNGFDAEDQIKRYVRWYNEGYLSSTGSCFDIGITVQNALEGYLETGVPNSGSKDPMSAGNGSIMRLAPIPLFYGRDMEKAIAMSEESSKTTHQAEEAIDGCRLLGGLIYGALQGISKEYVLSKQFVEGELGLIFHNGLAEIVDGSYKRLNPPEIKGTGYVVKSLEAALWAFYRSNNFEDGVLLAVNLGDDADTTGAVYGQLAGAYYGYQEIPINWVEKIAFKDLIQKYAEQLYKCAIS